MQVSSHKARYPSSQQKLPRTYHMMSYRQLFGKNHKKDDSFHSGGSSTPVEGRIDKATNTGAFLSVLSIAGKRAA